MAYYDPADTMRARPMTPLTGQTSGDIAVIKQRGQELYDFLAAMPQSADMTLAKRKVEEAVMWAVKAITA